MTDRFPPKQEDLQTRYGPFTAPADDGTIGAALRLYGEWAENELDDIRRFLSAGDVVFDVGACFGTHSVAFARFVGPEGHVTAFEASPHNLAYLNRNAALQSQSSAPIDVVAAIVSDGSDTVFDIRDDARNAGATSMVRREAGSGAQDAPPCVTIDQIATDRLDFVKIDVEGMEAQVLRGARQALRSLRPVLFFEANTATGTLQAIAALDGLDYVTFGHIAKAFNPNNHNGATRNMFGTGVECGIVAVPSERMDRFARTVDDLRLPEIRTAEDVVLMLLHKPQYAHEALAGTAAARVLEVPVGVTFADSIPEEHPQARQLASLQASMESFGLRLADVERTVEAAGRQAQDEGRAQDEARAAQEAALERAAARIAALEGAVAAAGRQAQDEGRAAQEAALERVAARIAALEGAVAAAGRQAQAQDEARAAQEAEQAPRLAGLLTDLEQRIGGQGRLTRDGLRDALRATARGVMAATPSMTAGMARPSPRAAARMAARIAKAFDTDWYRRAYPDVAAAGHDPVRHYLRHGVFEGRRPRPDFDGATYLKLNPDVYAAGVEPFHHWVCHGQAEGRPGGTVAPTGAPTGAPSDLNASCASVPEDPSPPAPGTADPPPAGDDVPEAEISAVQAHVDAAFYLETHPEVAQAGQDPVRHYCRTGWRAGYDPSPHFSTRHYLESNPDVADAGINPLLHYVTAGRDEGRAPRHPGGRAAETLRTLEPLHDTVRHWMRADTPGASMTADRIASEIARHAADTGRTARLMLSIGHDDFTTNSGGVQLCIDLERTMAADRGCTHLNAHPFQPLPVLAPDEPQADPLLVLTLDGAHLGACRSSDLAEALRRTAPGFDRHDAIVHSLLGHAPERVADLVEALGTRSCLFWLHDFFSICPSYTLQRNTISSCQAPAPESNACQVCRYGMERPRHLDRMHALFSRLSVHVVAPSQVTAEFWQRRAGLPAASVQVVPHAQLDWIEGGTEVPDAAPATVAFTGTPAPVKGWDVFEALVRTHRGTAGLRFAFFGVAKPEVAGLERHPVCVTAETRGAMIDALQGEGVDIVLHWAFWAETFSFSAHEALAAGAYVITNAQSGNVAATVRRTGRGAVLTDEADLHAFMTDGRLQALVRRSREERRLTHVRYAYGGISFDALAAVESIQEETVG